VCGVHADNDGTGCILGKCAAYSREWQAEPIDPATCKDGK
jgi:hypothetical protein